MANWVVRKAVRNKKPLVATGAVLCMAAFPPALSAETQFLLSIAPNFVKPVSAITNDISYGIGGTGKFTVRPMKYLDFFAQVDYLSLPYSSSTISMVSGSLGSGYHFAFNDRMSLNVGAQIGAYHASSSAGPISGLNGGASISFSYRINPVVSVDATANFNHYASSPKPLMTGIGIAPGISINLTEAFSRYSKMSLATKEVLPVFPVLYSWYENNKFGTVTITNEEDADITDVTVSFYQQQYMSQPNVCYSMKKVKKGESFDADLTAFFNERMLELTEETDTKASVIVEYAYLGQKRSKSFPITIPVYNRNAMSWDDDRRAAVFVSSKDPAALWFAKYITSIVRDNVRNGIAPNIQYAMGIFETLDQFGLNYVVDPTSAYEDNVGQTSIDFLQFPYQTLMYRGGDCDDLSILVSSLFEAIGIKTAFITIPGHIYMAFDTGLTAEQAASQFNNMSEFIIRDGEVWMPLEITLTDEGFNKAWRVGAREWNTAEAKGVANFYPMASSWKLYKPVSVPGASAHFTMPDRRIVAKLFQHRLDEWVTKEIGPLVTEYEKELAAKDRPSTRNSLGVLYGQYGLFTEAEDQFKKARRTGYIPAILNTANIFFAKQKYEKAIEWYNLVLAQEPQNDIALLGIARCQYELGNYAECDKAYNKLCKVNIGLAGDYTYLGSFENTKGRSFSLADRLATMTWSDPDGEEKKVVATANENATDASAESTETTTPVATEPKTLAELPGLSNQLAFTSTDIIPAASTEDSITPADEVLETAPILVPDAPIFDAFEVDEIDASETPAPVAATEAPVENREVPRFTSQPSAEWAPSTAYTIDSIPGMKTYEEEMGEYQNEKSFLYADEDGESLAAGTTEKKETVVEKTKTPEVDPFSSYLDPKSIKEVKEKQVAAITAYKATTTSSTSVAPVSKPTTSSASETSVSKPTTSSASETSVSKPATSPASETSVSKPATSSTSIASVSKPTTSLAGETSVSKPATSSASETSVSKPASSSTSVAPVSKPTTSSASETSVSKPATSSASETSVSKLTDSSTSVAPVSNTTNVSTSETTVANTTSVTSTASNETPTYSESTTTEVAVTTAVTNTIESVSDVVISETTADTPEQKTDVNTMSNENTIINSDTDTKTGQGTNRSALLALFAAIAAAVGGAGVAVRHNRKNRKENSEEGRK